MDGKRVGEKFVSFRPVDIMVWLVLVWAYKVVLWGLLTPFGMTHCLYLMSCFGSYLGSRPETLASLLRWVSLLCDDGKSVAVHT